MPFYGDWLLQLNNPRTPVTEPLIGSGATLRANHLAELAQNATGRCCAHDRGGNPASALHGNRPGHLPTPVADDASSRPCPLHAGSSAILIRARRSCR